MPWQVKEARQLAPQQRRGAGEVTMRWEVPQPCDVFWEMVILPSTVVVEGRVQEIRRRLWLLASAGKAGRKAIGSARCMAGLANSAVVLPAGCLWE